jgi:hypothetical protein
VGNGQDCLDGGDVVRRAKADFAIELAGAAGWLCVNDEGVLGGHVAASGVQKIAQKELKNW